MAQLPSIVLSATTIEVSGEAFIQAYQEGYLRFKTEFAGKALSDMEVYHFIAKNISHIGNPHAENAGYITGWLKTRASVSIAPGKTCICRVFS